MESLNLRADFAANTLPNKEKQTEDYWVKMNDYPCILAIAGSDCSGGAGIQADLKVISATGCYAATVITVITAQNTRKVLALQELSADLVSQQLLAVFSDLDVQAVKIGMLYSKAIIDAVVAGLVKYQPKNVILDPVMLAKSGCELLDPEVCEYLSSLFPLITLLTPNLPEAEKILHRSIDNPKDMETAAQDLGNTFNINVLIKGGHLQTKQASDLLYLYKLAEFHWFHAQRIVTPNTHGTGCTLSAAIASYLAQGYSLIEAITKAKNYLTKAIAAGKNLKLGHGHGPVHHFCELLSPAKSY